MPEYVPPAWTAARPVRGPRRELRLASRGLPQDVPAVLWCSAGLADDVEAPLLVVHDGPEYDELADLTLFFDAMVEQRRPPAMRAALLAPVDRNETSSASATYGRALALGLVPGPRRQAPTTVVVGMGASLGGLAMLQAQRAHPGCSPACTCSRAASPAASTSRRAASSASPGSRRSSTACCGRGRPRTPCRSCCRAARSRENVENNRLKTRALQAQGYDTRLVENGDVHTCTGWRDAFDPNLVDLVRRVLDGPASKPAG